MAKDNAFSTHKNEVALINYLLEHVSAAGDSKSFKGAVWKGASKQMPAVTKGGPKTPTSCKYKYGNVHASLPVSSAKPNAHHSFKRPMGLSRPFRQYLGGSGKAYR
jgi:hypothetical protein